LLLALFLSVLVVSRTDDGVLFQCQTNGARVVYLAGDFNGWASNEGGRITKREFAMEGPDINGVWRKVVTLDPGLYRFKFNINGTAEGWFAPGEIDERDADKNAIFRVNAAGDVVLHSARNPNWKPQRSEHGVLFQFYAPEAHVVYLAGDFNDWGRNRDGLVFNPQFAMRGPDSNGVWRAEIELPQGRHAYQFVVDGDQWQVDPNADETDNDKHSVVIVK
jgi:1,4-alpha-glucan branching enzyme